MFNFYEWPMLPEHIQKELKEKLGYTKYTVSRKHGGPFVCLYSDMSPPYSLISRLNKLHYGSMELLLNDGVKATIWYDVVGITL